MTTITYIGSDLPDSFDGYHIVQISDLHNKSFGQNNKALIALVQKENPDLIAITGDVIDERHTKEQIAISAMEAFSRLAPTYYVSGNHEISEGNYKEFLEKISDAGVAVLDNKSLELIKDGERISLLGLADASYFESRSELEKTLERLLLETNEFSLLLSHRPELFPTYAKDGVDLSLCGHAHGGQIRILGQGILSPHQGFFPKYTSGLYTVQNSAMVVSRGLGNSRFPFRVFNRPEVVSITLKAG